MLDNIQVILHLSRLYGCHPYIIDKDTPESSKLLRAYSYALTFAYGSTACYLLLTAACLEEAVTGCVLLQLRRTLNIMCIALCSLTSGLRYSKYAEAYFFANKFDEDTDCEEQEKCEPWILWLHVFWVYFYHIASHIYEALTSEVRYSEMCAQIIARTGLQIEIIKFYLLFDGLRRRFRRLNRLTESGAITISVNSRIYNKDLTVPDVYKLRECLMDSAGCLNAYYNLQLFSWFATLVFDITDTIVLHTVFTTSGYVSVAYSSILLLPIIYVCQQISNEADDLGIVLLAPSSPVLTKTTSYIDAAEFGFYLTQAPLKISVFNLFDVQMSLTTSVVSNILTYMSVFLDPYELE